MDLLQIARFFLENFLGDTALKPILSELKNNSFDLKQFLSSLSVDKIIPIVQSFISGMKNKSPTGSVGQSVGLSPVARVADKEIVYALNQYLANDDYS